MDIRDWPLDRIMQLPDHCFGQKRIVSVHTVTAGMAPLFDISEAGLSDRCVVWEIFLAYTYGTVIFVNISLALGDRLPANDAEYLALEQLFRDFGVRVAGYRYYQVGGPDGFARIPLRQLVLAQGRRLVGRFVRNSDIELQAIAGLVVSSIPTEVPDCLLSVHP